MTRYSPIHGGQDIKDKTVDKSRLTASGEVVSYVLKVQADGSLDFEQVLENLNDIGDVDAPSPENGDIIKYNQSTGKYENRKLLYDSDFRAYLVEN